MPPKKKWNLSNVPNPCMESAIAYLKSVENLHDKRNARAKLERHRDNSFRAEQIEVRNRGETIKVAVAEDSQRAVHAAVYNERLKYLISEIADLEQQEKTTFLTAKEALNKVLHNKRKEMSAWFPEEQSLFEMMEEDEPQGDYVDKKAAVAQIVEAKSRIVQTAEKAIAKWKDFQIAKATKRNTEIQNATIRKEILMEEVQRNLPIADQVASLRAQLAKSLILQEEKHKKGQRHGRSPSRSSSRSHSSSRSTNPSPKNGRRHRSRSSRSSNSTRSTRSRTSNHSSTTRDKGKGKQQRRSNKQKKREPPRRSTNPRPKSRPRNGKRGDNDGTRRGNKN